MEYKKTCSEKIFETIQSSKKNLEETSKEDIILFLKQKMNVDGGFQGRTSQSDLYYTLFGAISLLALYDSFGNMLSQYVHTIRHYEQLDFIHLCSFARLYHITQKDDPKLIQSLFQSIERYRSKDGGYNHETQNAKTGTVYASFLAYQLYEDFASNPPFLEGILESLEKLKTKDGAYANRTNLAQGTSSATAAAIVLKKQMKVADDNKDIAMWFINKCYKFGGFLATPRSPIPDILSTAVTLFSLKLLEYPLDTIKEQCLEFIDMHWDESGGFFGHIGEQTPDCEYTFYGLLALGSLESNYGL